MKLCPKCQSEKPATSFWRDSARPDGLQSWCKECVTSGKREWKERDPEGFAAVQSRAKLKNRLRHFGMSLEDWDTLLVEQGGGCAICGKIEDFCLDHDHLTGKVRGILCSACNRGIGLLLENPDYLRDAAGYIERSL